MRKNPNEDEDEDYIDYEVRDVVEQLPGYQEYIRENRGDSLTYGDM